MNPEEVEKLKAALDLLDKEGELDKANTVAKGSDPKSIAKIIYDEMSALVNTEEDVIGEQLLKIKTYSDWQKVKEAYKSLDNTVNLYNAIKQQFSDDERLKYLKPFAQTVIFDAAENYPEPTDYNTAKETLRFLESLDGNEYVFDMNQLRTMTTQVGKQN